MKKEKTRADDSSASGRVIAASLKFVCAGLALFILGTAAFVWAAVANIKEYVDLMLMTERRFVETVPIYEDYATPEREQQLRKYLNDVHLRIAETQGTGPVKSAGDISSFVSSRKLVPILKSDQYYFYNVDKNFRYLTPAASRGLNRLCERFQQVLSGKNDLPKVKIAISSALRPVIYQNDLKLKNPNASLLSTHCYGTTIDIFYDEYILVLPQPSDINMLSGYINTLLQSKIGGIMGGSLRRQLRTALMQTLLELQEQGALYAIQEKNQRCYHVTFITQ